MSEQFPPQPDQPTQPGSQPFYPSPSGPLPPPQPFQQPSGPIPAPSGPMPAYTQPLPQPGYPPGQPPMYPPPPPNRPMVSQTALVVILVVLILVCSGVSYAAGRSSSDNNTPLAQASPGITVLVETPTPLPGSPTPTPTPSATPTPSPTPKPPAWTTLETFKGVNNKKTSVFNIQLNDWRMVWTCTPDSFGGGNFAVMVYYSDGTYYDLPVNAICSSGSTHDVTEEHDGGMFYLDVTADAPWTIQVQVFE